MKEGSATTESSRAEIALCLSGGGFRATLFHLGALKRLFELGILQKIDVISCVSGGSIAGARLAEFWRKPDELNGDRWRSQVEGPILGFVQNDIRTLSILSRGLLWNWLRPSTSAHAIASIYEDHLTPLKLSELPIYPRIIFNATEMSYGVNWESARDRIGHYLCGYATPNDDWSVGRAVAASSCFPPVFPPLPVDISLDLFKGGNSNFDAKDDSSTAERLSLTDGGLYDNLGLEPVWKKYGTILVSDGGASLPTSSEGGMLRRVKRYTSIIQNQVGALRKRVLISRYNTEHLKGAYWSIGSASSSYGDARDGDYSKRFAGSRISRIRTDLDRFSDGECGVLMNHGYSLVDAAIKKHATQLLPIHPVARILPKPALGGDAMACQAICKSSKRRWLGRGRKIRPRWSA